MIDGKRVVAWTPYGRESTVSILQKYIARDHNLGIIDEYWLCMNTDSDQQIDRDYGYQLGASNSWIKNIEVPEGLYIHGQKQRNTGYFYRYMTDSNTVFVRLDDDIIYIHKDAISNLVKAKIRMRPTIACFGLTWNNAITSWYLQQLGKIPREFGLVGSPFCMDPVGWADGNFAVSIHRFLLDKIEKGSEEEVFLYQDMPLQIGQQFSVSYFASLGEDYSRLAQPGVLEPDEEEHWHTVHQTGVLNTPNIIIGNSLVSHFTFYPQRSDPSINDILQGEILSRYRSLAQSLQ